MMMKFEIGREIKKRRGEKTDLKLFCLFGKFKPLMGFCTLLNLG